MGNSTLVSGYPEHIMPKYAEVFQNILNLDKELEGQEWDSHKVYEQRRKYFN